MPAPPHPTPAGVPARSVAAAQSRTCLPGPPHRPPRTRGYRHQPFGNIICSQVLMTVTLCRCGSASVRCSSTHGVSTTGSAALYSRYSPSSASPLTRPGLPFVTRLVCCWCGRQSSAAWPNTGNAPDSLDVGAGPGGLRFAMLHHGLTAGRPPRQRELAGAVGEDWGPAEHHLHWPCPRQSPSPPPIGCEETLTRRSRPTRPFRTQVDLEEDAVQWRERGIYAGLSPDKLENHGPPRRRRAGCSAPVVIAGAAADRSSRYCEILTGLEILQRAGPN